MQDVKDAIRQFILSNYLPGESADNLRDDTPLLTSGILDSLATMNVATFIQERFGVELDFENLSAERFNRIQDIADSIGRQQGQRPTGGVS